MEKKWYIVQAHANFEKKVAEFLKERSEADGLSNFFGEVYVPTETVVETRRGRKISSERKIYPGYVFVEMHLTDETLVFVKNMPKVSGFLGADKPSPLTKDVIERVFEQMKEGTERPRPSIAFEVGEQVRVSEGPFASLSGHVEEVDDVRSRIKVAVQILGRATPVELEYDQVEKYN